MKNKFTLGTRLSLILILAIASSFVANVAQAESRQEQQAQAELSRTITKLVDLGVNRQWLVEAALNRAINTQVQSDPASTHPSVLGGAIYPVQIDPASTRSKD
jgi:transcription elongation GreA/GreB family factor